MKKSRTIRAAISALVIAMTMSLQAQITPVSLRIEQMSGDALIDASLAGGKSSSKKATTAPRFSWINQAAPNAQNESQKAYRIRVATSLEKLKDGRPDMWDSRKVKSSESYLVAYRGKTLKKGETYFWQVRTWNSGNKASKWSKVQKFSIGISPDQWKAQWIGSPWDTEEAQYSVRQGKHIRGYSVVPFLRKAFNVKAGIKSAHAYVTGLGYFEFYINGKKPGDEYFVPDFTNYGPRPEVIYNGISVAEKSTAFHVSYLHYDITRLLRNGQNAAGAMVAGGYYDNRSVRIGPFGSPRFICQIEIQYNDGTSQTVITDNSWKAHESPIVKCEMYEGENYDARKEIPNWCSPDYDDSAWKNVALRKAPGGTLTAHDTPPDRITETLRPIQFNKNEDGSYTVDFGESIAGWLHVKGAKGADGKEMKIYYESEYPQEVSYTFKDGHPIDYTPRFTWYVFRRVIIRGDIELTSDMLTAEAVNTDMKVDGEFTSSNSLFNTINKIWQRTEKDNIHSGVESDCPHRERLPYTGDGQAVCTTVMHNFDSYTFFRSWFDTMRDTQDKETGYLTNSAPWCIAAGGGVAWGAAMTLMPWEHYLHYGDKQVLAENYEAARRQVEYMTTWITPEGIMFQKRTNASDGKYQYWFNLGEWVPAFKNPDDQKVHTYMLWRCADRLSRMAKVLDKPDDCKYFADLAARTAKAYDRVFFNAGESSYGDYGANLMAIDMGAADGKLDLMKKTLHKEIVEKYKSHVNTGYLCTGLFYEVLARMGMNNVAYDAMNQTDFPSFGYWISKGATTFYEQYNCEASLNHPFMGCALTWFYRSCAGMYADENEAGYKHIIIRPTLADKLTQVKYAKHTPYGLASSEVCHDASSVSLTVRIPVGAHATVYLPTDSNTKPTVNGSKANEVKGVESVHRSEGCYILKLNQGTYSLRADKR